MILPTELKECPICKSPLFMYSKFYYGSWALCYKCKKYFIAGWIDEKKITKEFSNETFNNNVKKR
jgi:ribosomal protein L37AE/L43A